MIEIKIPTQGTVALENLLLDLNGTIAHDGVVKTKTKSMINALSKKLKVFILSADTRGNLEEVVRGIKAKVVKISAANTSKGKRDVLLRLGRSTTAVIGNGFNDRLILKAARLGIVVIGTEGASVKALLASDIAVKDIADALGLFLHPVKITATLRS